MIPILHPRRTVETIEYRLFFESEPGRGYSFQCDEQGVVDTADLTSAAAANYLFCLDQGYESRIQKFTHSFRKPAVGRCHCGNKVYLSDPLDNECQCGACYNMSGQQVTPSWECDETGEPYGFHYDV